MIKKTAMILAGFILMSGAAISYSTRGDAQQRGLIVDEKTEVSDTLVYGRLFRQIAAFYAKADQIEQEGGDGRFLRDHFKFEAGLTDGEAYWLDRVTRDYIREVALINVRQKAVVEAYRAQYPGGQVPHGQRLAPRPDELRLTGIERDQLYLRMRDLLRNAFGEEAFLRFDVVLRRKITPNNFKAFTIETNRPPMQIIEKEKP